MSGVFLSYRRDDVGLIAVDVADALKAKIDATVFFDLQSIEVGKDYQEEIDAALRKCSVVIVLLGKDWFGPKEGGNRRIDEPDDIFRQEIEKSLQSNAFIIPVLVGISSVDEESLGEIRNLADLQWHQIRLGQKKDDVETLVEKVQQALYERRQAELAGQKDGQLKTEDYSGTLTFVEPQRNLEVSPSQRVSFYNEDLVFRVNVAIISGRPLLIIGSEKSGSYGIVSYVARNLQWRFYTHTVTADTTVKDLLYSFDDVRRLSDAQSKRTSLSNSFYLEPEILWWAFDPDSARHRGASKDELIDNIVQEATDPATEMFTEQHSVILIESIENLKPIDVHGLMNILGKRSFVVEYNHQVVKATAEILVIFTSDSLRNVDPKVKHNSVVYELPYPSIKWLVENARPHFPDDQQGYIEKVADALTTTMNESGLVRRLELGDFITIIQVVIDMKIEVNGTNWRILLDSFGLLR